MSSKVSDNEKKKRERDGWVWNESSTGGGYWSRQDSAARHSHRKEFFCPHCRRPTGTIDDSYIEEYGICSVCYVMHVESRKTPTIDLSKYKKM